MQSESPEKEASPLEIPSESPCESPCECPAPPSLGVLPSSEQRMAPAGIPTSRILQKGSQRHVPALALPASGPGGRAGGRARWQPGTWTGERRGRGGGRPRGCGWAGLHPPRFLRCKHMETFAPVCYRQVRKSSISLKLMDSEQPANLTNSSFTWQHDCSGQFLKLRTGLSLGVSGAQGGCFGRHIRISVPNESIFHGLISP